MKRGDARANIYLSSQQSQGILLRWSAAPQFWLCHRSLCRLPSSIEQILDQPPLGAAPCARQFIQMGKTAFGDKHIQSFVARIVITPKPFCCTAR